MANKQRQRRISDQIQKELAEIIRFKLKDPRIGMVTVTAVEVSGDLAHAKIYYTQMEGAGAQKKPEMVLSRAAPFLRKMVGQRIRLHNVPELHFVHDDSVARGIALSTLIDAALKPLELPQPATKVRRRA
jgi:ribosome-binding factor A